MLESPHARDSKTLLDSGFYAVDSEFLELDSGLCFPNSRAVFWIPEGKFLRFRIPRQAKISPHSAIRMFEMERLVQVKSIIKKKKKKKKKKRKRKRKRKKTTTTKMLISLRSVIKRATYFNFTEIEIIYHLREFITSVKSYFPFSVAVLTVF